MNFRTRFFLAASFSAIATTAVANEVISNDLIVQGSACVGTPCLNDETFDFDTLRIKSATPQIRFQDTSNSASFPTNDWVMGITAGLDMTSVFYIQDVISGDNVMQIENGGSGGVALGAGSELVSGAVSVGAPASERRISHVADGVDATDAVTLAQFNDFEANASAAAAADIAAVNSDITDLQAEMVLLNQRLDEVVNRLNALQ